MRALAPAVVLLSCACTGVFFQPTRQRHAHLDRLAPAYETVRFSAEDGTPLAGLFFPAEGTAKGSVLHFHGNGQNMTAHFAFAHWLTSYGFHVFAFDYRGYGASGGRPSLRGAVADGIAALRYLEGRADVDPGRIVVFGQSLGGALAVASLADGPPGRVRAVALESTFASYASVAQDKLARTYILWPFQWPLSRLLFSTPFHAARHIGRLPAIPLLVVHGDADPIVPFRQGQALYRKAREPKRFWRIPGGGHTEAFTRYGSVYRPRLAEFFLEALK